MHAKVHVWTAALAVAALTLTVSIDSQAAPLAATAAIAHAQAAPQLHLPDYAKAGSALVGTFNLKALSAPSIELQLADGSSIVAELQRVARDDAHEAHSWIGTFADSPGSLLVLSRVRGVVSGFATHEGQTFELLPVAGGQHALYEVDLARIPQQDGVQRSVSAADASTATVDDFGTAGATSATTASAPTVQDVLIFYTPAAASAYGQSTLLSMIQSAVQAGLQAYQNSHVYVTLNVVGILQSPVSESSSGMEATLTNFRTNATVRSLRDKYAADMAALVMQDSAWCGWSNLGSSTSNGVTSIDAYAVVASRCLNNQSLAHELGHLQGVDHNREDAGSPQYPYGYGYRKCVSNGFRDVMSYSCPTVSVPRVANFSNPSVYYNGYATGISYELDPAHSAECARAMNNTATKVAGYRVATVSLPSAPSALVTTAITSSQVSLAWTDHSTNESGFQLERSTDGVNFSVVATLGANTTSATGGAVSAQTSYYYRVRAYNSAGSSAYSNTLRVTTTSGTLPTAPSALVTTSITSTQVSLAWTDNSTNESGFRLERSTDGVNFSVIATLGTNTVSATDAAVAALTTYYYRVRAYNSAGSSACSTALRVATPGAVPAAPTNVSAVNGSNGTAIVTWTDASSNESGFNISRARWDPSTSTWMLTSYLASTAANTTRFVNATGNGTYRYYVQAVNSSGKSAYIGPAVVTVTGG